MKARAPFILFTLLAITFTYTIFWNQKLTVAATNLVWNCVDYKFIYIRGSGQERFQSAEYKIIRKSLQEKFKSLRYTYELDDLEYPAINIDLKTGLGAFATAGRSLKYGKSVKLGVTKLKNILNNNSSICGKTNYILIGYSQGAQVLGTTLRENIDSVQITYAAFFGDPQLYLPESNDYNVCHNKKLSQYRKDVVDCKVESGILGARIPYVPETYLNKSGTWCNKGDAICGSGFNLKNNTAHLQYPQKIRKFIEDLDIGNITKKDIPIAPIE